MFTAHKSKLSKLFSNVDDDLTKNEKVKNITKSDKSVHQNGREANVAVKKAKETNKGKYFVPQKQFQARESLLIQLFEENRNVRAVYNISVASFIMFITTFTLKEYVHHHRLPTALNVIHHCFGKMHFVALIWIGNNFTTFLTYLCFVVWGRIRRKVNMKNIWDKLCILVLVGYYVLSFTAATFVIFSLNLPFASALIVSIESVRFLIKVHAFIRGNAPKILLLKSDEDKIDLPTFWNFLHFLYVPTVVYRDEYPRSKNTRWSFVFFRILEIFAVIIFLAYFFEYIVTPFFKDSCLKKLSLIEVLLMYIEFSLPATVILWSVFFVLLHSTQNAVGEALRFGDRLFYTDWWTCTDIQQYYRRWNLVIGDWLYTYIHKDMYEIISPGKRNLAKFVTIVISALVHEWICTVASGYFLPLLTTSMLLSVGMCLYLTVNKYSDAANVITIICIMLGTSYIVTFYALEHFTRQNFPMNKKFVSVFWTDKCVSL